MSLAAACSPQFIFHLLADCPITFSFHILQDAKLEFCVLLLLPGWCGFTVTVYYEHNYFYWDLLRHCINIPTQAVKKGASQTVVGLIFGCYAVSNLIGSLLLGKYVSILYYFFLLSDHFICSVMCCTRVTDSHSLSLHQIVQIGAKFMLVTGLFVSSVCTILFG